MFFMLPFIIGWQLEKYQPKEGKAWEQQFSGQTLQALYYIYIQPEDETQP